VVAHLTAHLGVERRLIEHDERVFFRTNDVDDRRPIAGIEEIVVPQCGKRWKRAMYR
jgi:hypothetical protein